MEKMERTSLQIEAAAAVICNTSGDIVKNGLRLFCPYCQVVEIHINGHLMLEMWRVGAIREAQCTKCRKRHHRITLNVPQGMSPEEFYRAIYPEGVNVPTAILELPIPKIRQKIALNSPQLSLFE